jgi:hypothetical protein
MGVRIQDVRGCAREMLLSIQNNQAKQDNFVCKRFSKSKYHRIAKIKF